MIRVAFECECVHKYISFNFIRRKNCKRSGWMDGCQTYNVNRKHFAADMFTFVYNKM